MATIPTGPGRRVLPQRAPSVQIADLSAPAQAVANAGAQGVQFGLQQQARQDAAIDQERRRQEQLREAAERARDSAHLQEVQDQLTDLHDEIGGQVLRGEVPKADAEKVWTERSRQVIDSGAAGFTEWGKQTIGVRLNGEAARLGNSVRRTVERKDREDVTADMTTRLERLQRDYAANPGKAQQEAAAVFESLGQFSTLSPSQLASARQKWIEDAQYTAGYEAVSRGRNDPKALADAEKAVGTLDQIDPQKRAVLQDRIAGYRLAQEQRREIAAQRAQREAERLMSRARAEFESFQALADKGGMLDPAYVDRVAAATAGTPYQAGVQALAKLAAENGGLAAQPIPAQQATLDAIDARIAQGGRSPELDKRRQQVAKVLEGSRSDLQRGGLRAALERGVIENLQPLNMTGGIEGVAQQLQQRVTDAQRAGQWAGVAVSPLLPEESQSLRSILSSQPANQRASSVAVLAAVVPPKQMQAIARSMWPQGEDGRIAAAAFDAASDMTTAGRYTQEIIFKGGEALKAKTIKEEKTPVDGWRGRINEIVSGAFTNPQEAEFVAEKARFILAGLVSEGASGSREDVSRAVRLAAHGDIRDINGARVPIPAGMTPRDVQSRLRSMTAQDLGLSGDSVYVSGRAIPAPEFLAGLPEAKLTYLDRGEYAIQAGGTFVSDGKGNAVVVRLAP